MMQALMTLWLVGVLCQLVLVLALLWLWELDEQPAALQGEAQVLEEHLGTDPHLVACCEELLELSARAKEASRG